MKGVCLATVSLVVLGVSMMLLLMPGCREPDSGRAEKIITGAAQAVDADGISLRNESSELVLYTLTWKDSDTYPLDRALNIGEIESYYEYQGLNITLRQGDRILQRRLDPGMNYSFGYDESGRLVLREGWGGVDVPIDLAPFLASPPEVVDHMLEMAQVDADDIVYDLGCGDGRIVIQAAKKYGARGVGIDFNPKRIQESLAAAVAAGVEELVKFRVEDVLKADFSEATVVTVYLLTRSNEKMRPLLEQQLKSGTLVVAHNYQIPGWENKMIDLRSVPLTPAVTHTLFLYRR